MVDGRTVGEAAPKSASTKEISALWAYLQDRIARLPKTQEISAPAVPYVPLAQPSLTKAPEADAGLIIEARVIGEVPMADRFFYDGPERRSGVDRREGPQRDSFFVGADYNTNVFGRRRNPYDTGGE
jgi:hypothetical protein